MSKFRESLNNRIKGRLAAEELEGDGEDPRFQRKPRRVHNRKALQLCSQVFQALSLSLSDSDDPLMQVLALDSVTLAPDTTQMLVVVRSKDDHQDVLASLNEEKGRLRAAIAAFIHRKKTPNLKFEVMNDNQ